MLVMSGKMNTTDPKELNSSLANGELRRRYLRRLTSYTPDEIEYRLHHYFKVMFVRHPFERLLSAYINKFGTRYNAYFSKRFGRTIVRRYRKNPSAQSLQRGDGVMFNEFIQYIVDPLTTQSESLNEHWQLYDKLCKPCVVKYNYVGKYETLSQDAQNVLRTINASHIHFPDFARSGKKTADLVNGFFANVSSNDLHRLWKMYEVDFEMFGYIYPNITRQL